MFESEKGRMRKHSTGKVRSEYDVLGEQASLSKSIRRVQASALSPMRLYDDVRSSLPFLVSKTLAS